MKNSNRLVLAILFSGSVFATQPGDTYRVEGNGITISKNGQSRTCKLDQSPRFAVESFDKASVIVSERGFVSALSLDSCVPVLPVHVLTIPDGVGVLADVNLSKHLYVSLDFVNVQPFLYLATVGRFGNRKNLVTVNGANVQGRKLAAQKRYAFGGSGDAGSAIISPDGRFVAPTAELMCRDDSYPGVWDVARNKRVVMDDRSCQRLFESH